VAAVSAATAAAVAAVASVTGTSTPAAWAALAATAAAVAVVGTLVWPRVATDGLGLHGTVFPSPADGGDEPLLGRLRQLHGAASGRALAQQYSAWQRAVGAGVNYQIYLFGRRLVVLVDPADVRAVTVRVDAPRDAAMLRHFGTPISADMLFLVPDPRHAAARRLVHPFLSGAPTAETVLRVVHAELGAALDAAPAPAAGDSAPARWVDRLDALAAAGAPVDVDDLMADFTLGVMHQLLYSCAPDAAEVRATAKMLLGLTSDMMAAGGHPFPRITGRALMASLRSTGDHFVAYAAKMEARRRAEYAAGTAAPTPPRDMLDLLLADLDKPGGAYEGDRRRVAADLLFYQLGGYDTTVRGRRARGDSAGETGVAGGRVTMRGWWWRLGWAARGRAGAPSRCLGRTVADRLACSWREPMRVCCGCAALWQRWSRWWFLPFSPHPPLHRRTPLRGRSTRCATTRTSRRAWSLSWRQCSPPPARP